MLAGEDDEGESGEAVDGEKRAHAFNIEMRMRFLKLRQEAGDSRGERHDDKNSEEPVAKRFRVGPAGLLVAMLMVSHQRASAIGARYA